MGGITLIFENTCNCIFEEEVLEKAIIQECNSRGVEPKNNYKIYLYRGYAGILIKHDKVSVHRIIANYMAGQRLSSNISVHHIDGNKYNNSLDNLIVFKTNADHAAFHKGVEKVQDGDVWYCPNKKIKDKELCPVCNLNYKDTKAEMCIDCWSKLNRKFIKNTDIQIPNREVLKNKITED